MLYKAAYGVTYLKITLYIYRIKKIKFNKELYQGTYVQNFISITKQLF